MPRVIHFEIHAEQPERAVRFLESVFGWTFNKWPGPMDYWLIKTGDEGERGIDGGLLRRIGESPGVMQAVNACVAPSAWKASTSSFRNRTRPAASSRCPRWMPWATHPHPGPPPSRGREVVCRGVFWDLHRSAHIATESQSTLLPP